MGNFKEIKDIKERRSYYYNGELVFVWEIIGVLAICNGKNGLIYVNTDKLSEFKEDTEDKEGYYKDDVGVIKQIVKEGGKYYYQNTIVKVVEVNGLIATCDYCGFLLTAHVNELIEFKEDYGKSSNDKIVEGEYYYHIDDVVLVKMKINSVSSPDYLLCLLNGDSRYASVIQSNQLSFYPKDKNLPRDKRVILSEYKEFINTYLKHIHLPADKKGQVQISSDYYFNIFKTQVEKKSPTIFSNEFKKTLLSVALVGLGFKHAPKVLSKYFNEKPINEAPKDEEIKIQKGKCYLYNGKNVRVLQGLYTSPGFYIAQFDDGSEISVTKNELEEKPNDIEIYNDRYLKSGDSIIDLKEVDSIKVNEYNIIFEIKNKQIPLTIEHKSIISDIVHIWAEFKKIKKNI